MKLTTPQLKDLIISEMGIPNVPSMESSRPVRTLTQTELRNIIEEGWFSGGLKGLLRTLVPGGNIAADAHTSEVLEALDKKLTDMENRIAALERRR